MPSETRPLPTHQNTNTPGTPLQGGDCYNFFLQWGLPKQTLKEVWDVVAGNQGFLTSAQFVSCLYLMDNAKRVRGVQV